MTTPPVDDPEALRRILGRAEALFLDFDGPVCNLFAGLPASVVVDQLCVVLADGGYGDPPPEIEKSGDPFDVLKYAVSLGGVEARYVNAAFAALESEAASVAIPRLGAHDLIHLWSRTERPLAIVSNNSVVAIETYLDLHGLRSFVAYVAGRDMSSLDHLKPDPYLLKKALAALHLNAIRVPFIGDAVTDVLAAQAVGATSIGYGRNLRKLELIAAAMPDVAVSSMPVIVNSLESIIRSM